MDTTDKVKIGRVVKPHGIRGELVVKATGDTLGQLLPGDALILGASQFMEVTGVRPHQGRVLVRVDGCHDRNTAETLRGLDVFVAVDRVAAPAPDEWFADDLVGQAVESPTGVRYGRIVSVLPGGAQDLLEIRGDHGVHWVPMVRDWLRDSQTPEVLVMELPEGLIELNATPTRDD